jgi:hypothetical protein
MNIKYAYSNGSGLNECEASDISEIQKHVQELGVPKKSLYLSPPNTKGAYLDFHNRADGSIEMEIMEGRGINDFATIDVLTASQVVQIAWSDDSNLPLKQKLHGLPIKWLT